MDGHEEGALSLFGLFFLSQTVKDDHKSGEYSFNFLWLFHILQVLLKFGDDGVLDVNQIELFMVSFVLFHGFRLFTGTYVVQLSRSKKKVVDEPGFSDDGRQNKWFRHVLQVVTEGKESVNLLIHDKLVGSYQLFEKRIEGVHDVFAKSLVPDNGQRDVFDGQYLDSKMVNAFVTLSVTENVLQIGGVRHAEVLLELLGLE